ncbi:3-oxo-5-alpha-steroid 4-dehydrogenase [Pseudomassariella vexata]|uniref:3-oxo-5-alpha-steroid 4-dehydrogenase n=1 Tax=Pseudomassariella vexata TaxID=1141098 RepID=A0A1Y2DYF7_9PEZI|nr:3-oxo-5-alpha-steroid 4-dehydrogenase [Pseudomassariella vexata]ORY64340.1 3-oxo-5-alpha-steroid 4-dehydrogenase [Pseudomassariella vexata]
MSTAELSLKLSNRSPKQQIKRLPPSVDLPNDATVEDAKIAVARKVGIADHNQIGLFDPTTKKTLKDRKALLRDLKYEELLVKDLGPQLAWRTVFLIEYFGPLLFHPLFLGLRSYIYPALYPYVKNYVSEPNSGNALSLSQKLTFGCVLLHFLKREYETAFVHRFSASTMPFWNIFRNSFFYWAVAGLLAAFEVYAPFSPAAHAKNHAIDALGLALFAFGETGNFMVHKYLSSLRSPGGTERQIPKGLGFGLVTSPNYMYEQLAWAGVILISRSPSVALFISIGMYYMFIWGKGKERAYRKEFGDKYKKKRYVMLPGLL